MNNDHPQLMKELQHPTAKYDYDGITGTWLLIPAKFHILMLAIALPIILWMFPFIHLKGNYRYIFADYRFYIAGAVSIFCLASALLSIVKARQVKYRIRPISDVTRQSVKRSTPQNRRTPKAAPASEKYPKIRVGQIKKNLHTSAKTEDKSNASPKNTATNNATKEKVADVITNGVMKTATQNSTKSPSPKASTKPRKTVTTKSTIKREKTISSPQKKSKDSAQETPQKNPKQMQLDL